METSVYVADIYMCERECVRERVCERESVCVCVADLFVCESEW